MNPALQVSDALLAGCTKFLEELCAISSASGDVQGLYKVAERIGSELIPFGLLPEINAENGADGTGQPVLIARGEGAGDRTTLLLGHMDTVLPAVPPRLVGGRLEGTGALDMKGGFAALVGALHLLREKGANPPRDLLLAVVPDEEIGGPISSRVVADWGRNARTVFVLEPGAPTKDGETLVTGRRGLTVWRLDAKGRAAHSGVGYWEGRSALAAAAAWASAVQKLSERGRGPVVNVGRIIGGDSEFVADLGEEHRFIGTSQRLNVVADRCLVEGEVRFLDPLDGVRVINEMRVMAREIARLWEVDFELAEVEKIPPVGPSRASGQLTDCLAAAAADSGWQLELENDRGGISFSNFLPKPTAVSVIDGLGPTGGGMHTRSEFLELSSLKRRIALIAEALIFVRDHE